MLRLLRASYYIDWNLTSGDVNRKSAFFRFERVLGGLGVGGGGDLRAPGPPGSAVHFQQVKHPNMLLQNRIVFGWEHSGWPVHWFVVFPSSRAYLLKFKQPIPWWKLKSPEKVAKEKVASLSR